MKKRKGIGRYLSAFVLASALIVSLAQPISSYAEEETTPIVETEEDEKEIKKIEETEEKEKEIKTIEEAEEKEEKENLKEVTPKEEAVSEKEIQDSEADNNKEYEVTIVYFYTNTSGKNVEHEITVQAKEGQTYGSVFETVKEYKPSDILNADGFSGWEISNEDKDKTVNESFNFIAVKPKYEGKIQVRFNKIWRRASCDWLYGFEQWSEYETLILDESQTKTWNDLENFINTDKEYKKAPQSFKGLRFKKWCVEPKGLEGDFDKNTPLINGTELNVRAEYENCMISFVVLDNKGQKIEKYVSYVAEKGEKFTIPNTIEGYQSVTWQNDEQGSFIVKGHELFRGKGIKGTAPSETSNSTVVSDKNTGISVSGKLQSGTVLKVDEVTEKTQKEVSAVLEKELGKNNVKNIKTFDISLLKDGAKVQPDGTIIVKIPLPEGFSNNIKVYWTENGKVQDMNGKVENGYVVFKTNHFSLYSIVDLGVNDVMLQTKGVTSQTKEVPQTGDATSTSLYLLISLASLASVALVVKHKSCK